MALLLNEIAWGEPLLPATTDPAWPAELKHRGAQVFEVDRRVAPSPWLRETAYSLTSYRPSALALQLMPLGAMVTAQENACRYCYGANRAYMKVLGYSEHFIQHVERDLQMAELDDRQRSFVAFCRSLARSRPRPSGAMRNELLQHGFSAAEVAEMTFVIAMGCFYNRISTFLACPPEARFERLANGPAGRVLSLLSSAWRVVRPPRQAAPTDAAHDVALLATGRFGTVLAPLAGLPAARVMHAALQGAFASAVLRTSTKALMFAVVARSLRCTLCESQASRLLLDDGLSADEVAAALASLRSNRLAAHEAGLLSWTRDTVSYDTADIQRKTRALATQLDAPALLEAIGIAALANATVRLAMLQE